MSLRYRARQFNRFLLDATGHARHVPYATGLRSTRGLCLPDFLGIGAQKAGTTWLFKNLRCHPELYLPPQKELHYFNQTFHYGLRFYSEKFMPGQNKIKGEITPGYCALPLSKIRLIRKIMPDVRLIFLLRNPVDRAWSHALKNLVKVPNRKFDEVPENRFYDHFKSEMSLSKGDYLKMLDNWLGVFPRDQFYIGLHDEIKSDPAHLLADVLRHLGVSDNVSSDLFPYLEQVINPGVRVPMPDRYRSFLSEMYRPDIERLYRRLGEGVRSWRV